MGTALMRDELPWMYEAGLDLSKAIQSGNGQRIDRAFIRFRNLALMSEQSGVIRYLTRDSHLNYQIHAMLQFVDAIARRLATDSGLPTRYKKRTLSRKAETNEEA